MEFLWCRVKSMLLLVSGIGTQRNSYGNGFQHVLCECTTFRRYPTAKNHAEKSRSRVFTLNFRVLNSKYSHSVVMGNFVYLW